MNGREYGCASHRDGGDAACTNCVRVPIEKAEGKLLDTIRTPALRPTSCAFAGPDGGELFISSSAFTPPDHVLEAVGISRERVDATEREEHAGALFVCRPGCTGPAASPYSG